MTTEKMNVHKALAELKILDDRIVKAINSVEACISFQISILTQKSKV